MVSGALGDGMTRIIYVADFRFDSARIASVEVEKETAKQFQVRNKTAKQLRGSMYMPSRLNKDEHHCFVTLREAEIWCLNAMQAHYDYLSEQVDELGKQMDELEAKIRSSVE